MIIKWINSSEEGIFKFNQTFKIFLIKNFSSSDRDSFKNKKRPRSESNYARDAREVSSSGLGVKSKSNFIFQK